MAWWKLLAATLRDVATQIEQFRAVVGGLIANAGRATRGCHGSGGFRHP